MGFESLYLLLQSVDDRLFLIELEGQLLQFPAVLEIKLNDRGFKLVVLIYEIIQLLLESLFVGKLSLQLISQLVLLNLIIREFELELVCVFVRVLTYSAFSQNNLTLQLWYFIF